MSCPASAVRLPRRADVDIYDIQLTALDGSPRSMGDHRGKTLLVVNVASRCGYTPQYEALEALYRKHRDRGFVVLGFPCNQFGSQEPGSAAEIAGFCRDRYDITFPIFAKIDVNGDHTHPLYDLLKHACPGVLGTKAIKWNFTKFLIGPRGVVVKRYAPSTRPAAIEADVVAQLDRPGQP